MTIFGGSAGGISVSMLAASPAAKGLFQRAISESGGSFAPPRYDDEGGETVFALKVAEAHGEDYLKRLGVAAGYLANHLRGIGDDQHSWRNQRGEEDDPSFA